MAREEGLCYVGDNRIVPLLAEKEAVFWLYRQDAAVLLKHTLDKAN